MLLFFFAKKKRAKKRFLFVSSSPGLRESTCACGHRGEGSALPPCYTPSLSRCARHLSPERGEKNGRPMIRTPRVRVARAREPGGSPLLSVRGAKRRGNLPNLNKGDSHVTPSAFLGMTKMRAIDGRPYNYNYSVFAPRTHHNSSLLTDGVPACERSECVGFASSLLTEKGAFRRFFHFFHPLTGRISTLTSLLGITNLYPQ